MPGKVHTWKIHEKADWDHQWHEGHSCGLVGGSTGKIDNCCLNSCYFFGYSESPAKAW